MTTRLLAVLAFVCAGAASAPGVACEKRPSQTPSAESSDEARLFERFDACRRGRETRHEADAPLSDAVTCLSEAAPGDRIRVARFAAHHTNDATRRLGILLLVSLNEECEAAPIVGAMVERGENFEAIGFALVHSGMERGALRLYAETGEYLLDPARQFPRDQYLRMRQFVCANAPRPVEQCTEETARAALREARIAAQQSKP